MADASINLQASNLFGLGAEFKTQSSGTSEQSTNVSVLDELGNVACQTNILDITNYTQTAQYCGATVDFVADLGTFLTQFGNVQNSKVVTGLTINMTAGEYCTIDIEGHNHAANAHTAGLTLGYADVSNFLPHEVGESFVTWDGFGVPDFNVDVSAGDASPISATVTFSMTHVDQVAALGQHLVGKNITPRCELTMEFSGVPAAADTIAEIQADLRGNTNSMLTAYVDSLDKNDANSDFDSMSFTAHANTTLAT